MERRSFSQYEQNTIRTIVNNASNSVAYLLVNAYNDIFYYTNVEYVNGALHIHYSEEDFNTLDSDSSLTIQKAVIIRTLLLRYLVENQYIYLVEDLNIQNPTTDIKLANKNNKKYDLEVDVPEDIADFLNKLHRRVIVSEELVVLVNDNFMTPEDKLLKGIHEQLKSLQMQNLQLAQQRSATQELVEAAKKQTAETLRQTELAAEQSKQAFEQTNEAKTQSVAALKQTEEAQKQSTEAKRQTEEAIKQTAEALKQTAEAFAQTTEAKNQTEESLKQTNEALKQTAEAQEQTKKAQRQTTYSLIVLIVSIVSAFATICISNKQRQDELDYYERNSVRQEIVDSIQTQIIQSVNNSTIGIKNNTDTMIFQQKVMNQNVRRINR